MVIFYKTENDRSNAIQIFTSVRDEMRSNVKVARDFLKQKPTGDVSDIYDRTVASYVLDVWHMDDNKFYMTNNYAPKYFGIEISERIFWEMGLARMRFLKEQFQCWASSFARLDPRYRICKFFNMAAQHGDSAISNKNLFYEEATSMGAILGAFYQASVFTVWRPTSNIAIKRMIEGTGVGKGMDISGKTAKLGWLSGYVPFLQVSPQFTGEIRGDFDQEAKVRIFYATESARTNAINKLERVRKQMIESLRKNKSRNGCNKLLHQDSETRDSERYLWDMGDAKESQIILIDAYISKSIFGIEIPEKLMWEGYVTQIDCYRLKHSSSCSKSNCDHGHSHRTNFAEKLMAFMMDETILNKEGALKWTKNENKNAVCPWSLILVNRRKIEELVLKSKHFKANSHVTQKDSCFMGWDTFITEFRQAGFSEETTGEGFARFYHALFQKGHAEKCVLVGSEHDTGRPSTYSWQISNLKSLCNNNDDPKRRVVLWSQPDPCNPLGMCPYNLLMAYEENSRVVPVVSDFDCFLVGTKRIPITALSKSQVEMMKMCVTRCEDILDRKETGSFGNQWDETGGKLPGIGWGDRKTKKLMSSAIEYLEQRDGCVRHAAECFNFVKPSDMDTEFLIIFEMGVKRKIRWQLTNENELVSFLSHQVNKGYTFPLNPKWVICDTLLWKPLYDKLMMSKEPNVEESQKVWYPKPVRAMIKRIHKKHEFGFSSYHGSVSKLEIKARYRVIQEIDVLHGNAANGTRNRKGVISLVLQQGNITQFFYPAWKKSAIVVAMNETCEIKIKGVGKAVFDAGRPELEEHVLNPDILPIISENMYGPIRCNVGDAKRITSTSVESFGELNVKHVILACGPDYSTARSGKDIERKDEILKATYHASLRQAKLANLECVAFSLLSAGNRTLQSDPNRPLRIAIKSICEYNKFGTIEEVHICCFTKTQRECMEAMIPEISHCKEYDITKITCI
eukprot:CAMPEP_0194356026 /NCGR_PEP_ID=MMETSP0174-20130528/3836_1 /TAXON_ID=216777 /ORGANISM="Proboscia alata, Strain PI-D3" /LENGTH=965 /DNA_ID=CAMNT_0039125529 /DNA_START=599 /DNA_END=3496 /DNA_ORIENTATION=+